MRDSPRPGPFSRPAVPCERGDRHRLDAGTDESDEERPPSRGCRRSPKARTGASASPATMAVTLRGRREVRPHSAQAERPAPVVALSAHEPTHTAASGNMASAYIVARPCQERTLSTAAERPRVPAAMNPASEPQRAAANTNIARIPTSAESTMSCTRTPGGCRPPDEGAVERKRTGVLRKMNLHP